MIPKSELKEHNTMVRFLTDTYKGVDDKFSKEVFEKNLFLKEKLRSMQELDDLRFFQNMHKEKRLKEYKDSNIKDLKDAKDAILIIPPTKKLHTEHGFVLRPTGHYQHIPAQNSDTEPPKRRGRKSTNKNGNPYMIKKNQDDLEDICHYEKCTNETLKEDFLICQKCNRTFHAMCCDPPLSKKLVERYDWYCNECKACYTCGSNTDENKMLICDICDRAFHLHCLNPKMKEIPPNGWYCNDCVICKGCKTNLKNEPNFPNLSRNLTEMKMLVCSNCLEQGGPIKSEFHL